jgi:nicotinamide phosphoribosyltransferase
MNKLLLADFYKAGHHLLMPKGVQNVFGYAESRGCDCGFTYCIPFGLQGFLKEYLEGQFVTEQDIEEAKAFFKKGFGFEYFNEAGWRYVLEKHNGRLPISIQSAPEGAKIPLKKLMKRLQTGL